MINAGLPLSAASSVFPLRLASAVLSAAAFGLIAAPLISLTYWPAAFLLAFGYGFFFLGGTGYRILVAVALRDPSRNTAASWSGATAASALAALVAGVALWLAGSDPALLLAAYAVAINFAYLFVKLACLGAGCCTARRPLIAPSGQEPDLRHIELALTLVTLVGSAACLVSVSPAATALVGLTGHVGVRLLSRWARYRMPSRILTLNGRGQGVGPLALTWLLAIALVGWR